ncbi:hypothetical protein IJT93_04000 [bacterium]|nr:hypothetical protein [bacterium]
MNMKILYITLSAIILIGGAVYMLSDNKAFADILANIPPFQPGPPVCGGTEDYTNTDAPKVIKSKKIEDFRFRFDGSSAVSMGDDPLPSGRYELQMRRIDGEKAEMSVKCTDPCQRILDIKTEVPAEALDRLQKIIDDQKLAEINGWYKRNSALGCSFNLSVVYDSQEKLTAGGEGGCSVVPHNLGSFTFVKLFKELAVSKGFEFVCK